MARIGVSTLVSVTLMIVFTIGIAVILMQWAETFSRGNIEPAKEAGDIIAQCAPANIEIEDVSITLRGSTNTSAVKVKNTGSINVNLTLVGVYDTSNGGCDILTKPTTIKPRESSTFEGACNIFVSGCKNFKAARVYTTCSDVSASLLTKPNCYE